MSKITLDEGEIRKLKQKKFPITVITQRYALRLLEKHTQELPAAYKTNPAFSVLIDRLSEISGCIDEGYAYIDQYLENEGYITTRKTRLTFDGPNEMSSDLVGKGAITIRDLDEFFKDLAESYGWLSVSSGAMPLSEGLVEQLEKEMNGIWEDVREVGYKAQGILIGADFVPWELISGK